MCHKPEVSQLQSDLDALALWSETWLMPFNENKCKVLHIGHSNPSSRYTMRNSQIGVTDVEKDLGVFVDAELKFRRQAAAVVAKATQLLAVIRRSFAQIDEYSLRFCTSLWSVPILSSATWPGAVQQSGPKAHREGTA